MSKPQPDKVQCQVHGTILQVTINRPSVRNCVDGETTRLLHQAFEAFEHDHKLSVAVLHGHGEHFCAGADLKAVSAGDDEKMRRIREDKDGPMGPTRMQLSKPVIAAVSGYCVAGGLELAAWCDLRVADQSAVFGVFCRRFGVPLIDGGTVRLPRLIGMSHAMDMILSGRPVAAQEAARMGLVNRLVDQGQALSAALQLAEQLAGFPQMCMRGDRLSALQQWGMDEDAALSNELSHGRKALSGGETVAGASQFAAGAGRHGDFQA